MIFSVRTFPRSRVRGDSVAEYEKAAVLDREPPQIRKPERVLLADSRHARELDAFHVFEQRAAARRDVRYLVGQTELWENKLKLQRYAAIRQRIDMYCILPHLDRSETEQYIASNMDYSGCAQEVFTTKALDEIHKASAGIPRMINRICEKALMFAFQNHKRLIDDYMIKYVVEHEMLGTMTT